MCHSAMRYPTICPSYCVILLFVIVLFVILLNVFMLSHSALCQSALCHFVIRHSAFCHSAECRGAIFCLAEFPLSLIQLIYGLTFFTQATIIKLFTIVKFL